MLWGTRCDHLRGFVHTTFRRGPYLCTCSDRGRLSWKFTCLISYRQRPTSQLWLNWHQFPLSVDYGDHFYYGAVLATLTLNSHLLGLLLFERKEVAARLRKGRKDHAASSYRGFFSLFLSLHFTINTSCVYRSWRDLFLITKHTTAKSFVHTHSIITCKRLYNSKNDHFNLHISATLLGLIDMYPILTQIKSPNVNISWVNQWML